MEEGERDSTKPGSKETPTASCSSVPSVPEHEPAPDSEPGDDDADKVDVCSEKFDPLLALYSPTVSFPFPNVKCFNNVAEYESFLRGGRGRAKPENVEKRQRKAKKGVADPERIERLKKLMVNNPVPEPEEGQSSSTPRSRKQKPQKNVLTRMPLCKGSPLGELYRCVQERIRVKVHIRTFKGLRGVCSGFVVAFDKFWNMAMVDVDETYREPLLGEALYHEKALTVTRLFEKLKVQESLAEKQETARDKASKPCTPARNLGDRGQGTTESEPSDSVKTKQEEKEISVKKEPRTYGRVRTRHINQLFIRGESVLLVNPQPL